MPNETFRSEAAQLSGIRHAMKYEERHAKPLTVVRQVETADEAERMFDAISYSKGDKTARTHVILKLQTITNNNKVLSYLMQSGNGLLLMLRNFVGHETFRSAVATYMERLLV